MSEMFIKFIRSSESEYLAYRYPLAAALLQLIAYRARREGGHPDGLKPGECFIGDWAQSGMTEQQYRTAKDHLEKRGHIEIVETNRTRKGKNATTDATTGSTKVRLISTSVYDININVVNDCINDRATTEQRQTKNVRKKEASSSSVFKSLADIKDESLTDEEKERICKRYSEAEVNQAIAAVFDGVHIPRANILMSINAALKGKWKPGKKKEDDFEINKKFSEKFIPPRGHGYIFHAEENDMKIIKGNYGVFYVPYKLSEKVFQEKLKKEGKL